MVEEHSTNLTTRIDSDYPNSIPAPISSSACHAQEPKHSDPTIVPSSAITTTTTAAATATTATPTISQVDVINTKPLLGTDDKTKPACDVDIKCANNDVINIDNFKSDRPNSIESRRSKSLCNTSSVDSSVEEVNKKDVKKTKSNPVKAELFSDTDKTEANMTVDENASPLKDNRSSPENQRSDSPKPGCSSQPDIGLMSN